MLFSSMFREVFMQIFLDTGDIAQIKENLDFIDGVTTNPSILSKVNKPYDVIAEIASIVDGPVSLEVVSSNIDDMKKEIDNISTIAENIVVKIPCNRDGFLALKYATSKNVMTNLTLCFSVSQALLAAKFGATYVSPFIGRLDDISLDGVELISDICSVYTNYAIDTGILAASVRSLNHVVESFKCGVDAVTVPVKILHQMITHPLTKDGLDLFMKDWNSK